MNVNSVANGVADADVYQGEGIVAMRADDPSTPGVNSEATANGRFGVDVAGNGRVSPVDVFQDAQDMAVNRSVVSSQHPS
mmetsp:Transcript_60288/g.97702  ORF Transcript_60288/g.97702 Transcript_60288/m.97702 type:complete len:80 (-) Transcript_60288:112-351(-)